MQCVFSPRAEFDLEEIGDYIARDNPTRAISFLDELRERCIKIADWPLLAPLRPELGEDIRMEAAIVKLVGGQAAFRCADRALQIHGGTGCDSEMPIERFWRWSRITRVAEGTDEILTRTIARMVLEQ